MYHIQHHNTLICWHVHATVVEQIVSELRFRLSGSARVSLHRSSQRLPFTPIQLHSCCILQSLYPLLELRKRIETIANFPLAKFNRPQNGLGHALEWTARWDVLGMYTWLLTGSRKWRACALRALNFNGDVQSYDACSSKHFVFSIVRLVKAFLWGMTITVGCETCYLALWGLWKRSVGHDHYSRLWDMLFSIVRLVKAFCGAWPLQ